MWPSLRKQGMWEQTTPIAQQVISPYWKVYFHSVTCIMMPIKCLLRAENSNAIAERYKMLGVMKVWKSRLKSCAHMTYYRRLGHKLYFYSRDCRNNSNSLIQMWPAEWKSDLFAQFCFRDKFLWNTLDKNTCYKIANLTAGKLCSDS